MSVPARKDPAGPAPCRAPGCDRAAVARGLCMKHYKRERAGRPLVDRGPVKGDPDGHGRYGLLDDDGQTVGCHECGARVAGLGAHVQRVHEMSAREYKLAHGLPLTRALSSAAHTETLRERSRERMGTSGWARFEAARDPAAAAAARGPEAFAAMSRHADPARAISNGRAARRFILRECPVCLTQWCPLPGGYRRVTCSDECLSQLVAWSTTSHPLKDPARDARIYADVKWRGMDPGEVGARHGLGRDRVTQIVRTLARAAAGGSEPDPRPDVALQPSQADAWWIERADAVGAYWQANGHLPYTEHPDPKVDDLAWWLHQQTQAARQPPRNRRERYRRAYLLRVAPTWDPDTTT